MTYPQEIILLDHVIDQLQACLKIEPDNPDRAISVSLALRYLRRGPADWAFAFRNALNRLYLDNSEASKQDEITLAMLNRIDALLAVLPLIEENMPGHHDFTRKAVAFTHYKAVLVSTIGITLRSGIIFREDLILRFIAERDLILDLESTPVKPDLYERQE